MLFDLEKDPEERDDISAQHPKLTQELLNTIEAFKEKLPSMPHYWMVDTKFLENRVSGDCSGQNVLSLNNCIFAHYWLPDSTDLRDEEGLGLQNAFHIARKLVINILLFIALLLVLFIFIVYSMCLSKNQGFKRKKN